MVLIADPQVGGQGNAEPIRRLVARLIAQRPAVVLIAGDFTQQIRQKAYQSGSFPPR